MTDFARYLNIRSATSPCLSPDGSRVAFLSDITGNFQLWSVTTAPDACQWPHQLTFLPDKVWEVHGTSAASHLLAVSDVGGNERQQFYLITGYGASADDEGHDVYRLTSDDEAIHRFGAWSSDGQQILYTSNARNQVDFDLYRMNVAGGEAQRLHEMSGNRTVAAWSPDERFVLVLDAVGPLQVELYLIDLQHGGLPADAERQLSAGFYPARYDQVHWTDTGVYLLTDRTHDRGALCRLDTRSGDLEEIANAEIHDVEGEFELLTVSPDGTQAAYTYNAGGYSQLWRVNLEIGEGRYIEDLPAGQVSHMALQNDGTIVLDLQTPNRNADVWAVNGEGEIRQLTFSDRAGFPQKAFILPTLIHFETFDGLQIPAFYYLPQSPQPQSGFPCILYVHGGPTSQLRPDFDVRFQYFLSRGYAILGTNVRGSTGYGREYAEMDELEKRLDSVTDLKHAVLWLQQQDEIDDERIAIYGRSYGGYMVLAALTEHPQLFAAGIDVVGIANWVSFLERTSAWRRAHREKEYGSLAHDRALLERISPLHKAERIQMPLLVVAGDNDPRVPLYESEQIAARVRAAGGTVQFVHYADEGHKISKLANRIDSFTRMAAFLDEYL